LSYNAQQNDYPIEPSQVTRSRKRTNWTGLLKKKKTEMQRIIEIEQKTAQDQNQNWRSSVVEAE
jgi:hypothetical protein